MAVVQGEVFVHNYHYLTCNVPENQNVVGIDCVAGGRVAQASPLQTGSPEMRVPHSLRSLCCGAKGGINKISRCPKGCEGSKAAEIFTLLPAVAIAGTPG